MGQEVIEHGFIKGIRKCLPLESFRDRGMRSNEKILRLEMDYNGKEEVVCAFTALKAIMECLCQRIVSVIYFVE